MILTLSEIIQIVIMTVVVGWIFSGFIKTPRKHLSDIDSLIYKNKADSNILFGMAVAAPAIILHEFGHKFLAMTFGYSATFHASFGGLAIGVILKLLSAPFLVIIPAYVSIPAAMPALESALVAFAGPAVNLFLWAISLGLLQMKNLPINWVYLLKVSAKLNLFLFIFNLIPIPPFDGYQVISNLIQLIL